MAVNVGKAEVATGVSKSKAFVIEAKKVQEGSLKVVDMDFVFRDVKAEIVCLAVSSGFGAATCHEGGESLGVVITTSFTSKSGIGFDHRSATEFSASNDQCFIKEAVALEVLNESGGCLGGLFAVVLC